MSASGGDRVEAAARARLAAQRQAPALSGAIPALAAMAVVLVLMTAIILLDYKFEQDPHRILKVAIALGGYGFLVLVPKLGLFLLPVVAPFLPWVPPLPLPGLNALNLILFAIFGTYAAGKIMRRQPLVPENRLGPMLVWITLLCAISVVRGAAFPTGYYYDGVKGAINVFRSATTFATYFIVLALARGPADRQRVWWAVLTGLLLESVVTAAYGRNGSGGRALGSIGQSNDLGAFFALYAAPALAGVWGVRKLFGKLVLLGIFAFGCFGVILSLSRGSMVALVAGVFVVAWLSSRWAVGLLLLVVIASPLWAPDYLKDRIASSSVESGGADQASLDAASEARLQTWQSIFEVVEAHPLDGVGFTGLAYVLPDVGADLGLQEARDSAHNTWLRMIGETGVTGLVLFAWLLWKCWALGRETMKKARRAFDRSLGVGLCGATVALAVNCTFGDRFFNVVIASSFWILCALAEGTLARTESP